MSTPSLLEIQDLKVHFGVRGKRERRRAVDGVSLRVGAGETVGLVGESGCGKTTIGNAVLGLVPVTDGGIRFRGQDIRGLSAGERRRYRREVQMIFQDPFASLNPRMRVGDCLEETLAVHRLEPTRARRRSRAERLLESVGLDERYSYRYPHELSGGQRQRVGIARALALGPSLLIADEPVSALDVSVQVQILNVMQDLQREMGLGYLFIAHDLAVVSYMCRYTVVMYLGRLVECGPSDEVFRAPAHPYTEALISAVPDVRKGLLARGAGSSRIVLAGDVPASTEVPPGCPFHPRCHRARQVCAREVPELLAVTGSRSSACLLARDLFPSTAGGPTGIARGSER